MNWQPIDTAPKDGTQILLCGGVFDWDGSYCTPESRPKLEVVVLASWKSLRDAFTAPANTGHDDEWYYYPTHWLPLPEPPK